MAHTGAEAGNHSGGVFKDLIVSIFIALYILCFYIPLNTFPEMISRVILYGFLGITFFKLATRQTPLKITPHFSWYLAFILLGFVSSLYAIKPSYVFSDLYTLAVTGIVSFSFAQYIRTGSNLKFLFIAYAYSPYFLVFYLAQTGAIAVQSERLGQTLFGNANRLAMYMMISIFCLFWLILYSRRRYLPVNAISLIVMFYITALTGGRKYLVVPFVFFLLLLVFKNWRRNKLGLAVYFLLFLLLAAVGGWAIMNIPSLYDTVGVRFEGLLRFFEGDYVATDASTVVRYMMISQGWKFFLKQPLFGYGLNNFAFLFGRNLGGAYAHNNFIELLVDLGIVGFAVYYSFYAYIIGKLFLIRDDQTGLRNFFLAFMLALLVFEVGGVTYQYAPVQIFIGLAAAYIWLYQREHRKITKVVRSDLSLNYSTP